MFLNRNPADYLVNCFNKVIINGSIDFIEAKKWQKNFGTGQKQDVLCVLKKY